MIKAIHISKDEAGNFSGYIDTDNSARIRFSEKKGGKEFIHSGLSKSEKTVIFGFVQKFKEMK